MARPKLEENVKAARLAKARRAASKLNEKLASHTHTYCYATESGRLVIYFEPPGQRKVRIRSEFGSLEFDAELLAAKRGEPLLRAERPPRRSAIAHTWRWACLEYFANDRGYGEMSARDKGTRKRILEGTWGEPIFPGASLFFGDMPLSEFNAESVVILMKRKLRWTSSEDRITGERRDVQTNISAANNRRKAISAVLSYLVQDHTRLVNGRNWARDIKRYRPQNEHGHRTPSIEELDQFRLTHPLGTRARLLFDIAYYTTQRRADLPRLERQFIRKDRQGNERLVFVQHKLRNTDPVTAYVPLFPELQESLEAASRAGILGNMLYLVHPKRSPLAPDRAYREGSLGNLMQEAVRAAMVGVGLPTRFSLHGLRKAGVCRLILADLTVHQIMAITGHRTPDEIDRYGREYMRSAAAEAGYQQYLRWRERNQVALGAAASD